MSFARVFSAQTSLLDAHLIRVEIDLARGLHAFSVVGLPDKAVEESRDRVSAALKNAPLPVSKKFTAPKHSNMKVVVSLAPAHLKKEGALFDTPIAISYLLATGELEADVSDAVFVGELSLDGELRPVAGALALAQCAAKSGKKALFVPADNADEAARIHDIDVYAVHTLAELVAHLSGAPQLPIHTAPPPKKKSARHSATTLDDIQGQEHAKRGLTIAAAGGHNIALYGPPGTGKTMLAKALRSLLPPLAHDTALEVTAIHSIAGALREPLITEPPLRSPHHTASYVSLAGGGTTPRAGEVTLAHRGVLFLDEFPEFDRRVINALRQPLEDGVVSITRSKGSAQFPSDFILIAALNPCPCGHYGADSSTCTCTPAALQRYRQKLSGPIMDRIDMWIEVGAVDHEKLLSKRSGDTQTQAAREAIARARARQHARFKKPDRLNAGMSTRGLTHHATLNETCANILNTAAKKLDLSARAYHRTVKLARTIADIDDAPAIDERHILEALQYRPKQEH